MRYCAFLDILGFKAMLAKLESPTNTERLERLISALNFMAEEVAGPAYSADLPVYALTADGVVQREFGDPRLTYVSDCIVISTEHTPDGLKALCRKVSKIWLDLAWDGFFCRGAIAQGLLFHEGPIVFGSAYLRAYELERVACSPRVIFASEVVDSVGGFPSDFPIRRPNCEQDGEGIVYLRYFPRSFFPPYAYDWTNFLMKVRDHILRGLANEEGNIREKYSFLRHEFNFAVEEYRDFLGPELVALDSAG